MTRAEPTSSRPPALGTREFAFLQALIMQAAGIHLGEQKRSLVEGRLARRLRHHGIRDYKPYVDLLQYGDQHGVELLEFINALTTNKTSFFRERHHFDYLVQHVFPAFRDRAIRIWSAGCSTGEEAYSLAMTARDAHVGVEILATDIDTKVLATARAGIYRGERIGEISPDVLERHFLRGEGDEHGLCRVRPEVQRLVSFERLNLVDAAGWPARGRFDVILCRNVIIYFNRVTQDTLFRRFAERLRPGGAMIVGHSENLAWLPDLFEPTARTVYRRHAEPRLGAGESSLMSPRGQADTSPQSVLPPPLTHCTR